MTMLLSRSATEAAEASVPDRALTNASCHHLRGVQSDPPAIAVAQVIGFESLTSESLRLSEKCVETLLASEAASRRLREQIGEEAWDLAMDYVEGAHDLHVDTYHELVIAELARHLPGLAPAIYAVWHHIVERTRTAGECCV